MSDDEGYPPDYEFPMPYRFERYGRYSIQYTAHGKTAHIISGSIRGAVCGMDTWVTWYGTGTMREYEKVRTIPLCKRCIKAAALGPKDMERDPTG